MHEQRSLNDKFTLSSLGNWMLTPLIFNFFFVSQYVSITSLSQTVFTMSIFCAFYFPVLKIADPLYLWAWIQKRRAIRPLAKL